VSSPSTSEIDRLDPTPEVVELVSGRKVAIQRLKLRQLFRLLRIVTRGGAGYLPMLRDAMQGGADEFGTQLIAIAVIALPEAEDEAVECIMSCVEPAEVVQAAVDKQQRELNERLRRELGEELYNPEPEDAITIIEAVINREKGDLAALGKRLGAAFRMAEKTGQLEEKAGPASASSTPTPESSEASPEPQTSSRRSTAGRTSKSSTSESAE